MSLHWKVMTDAINQIKSVPRMLQDLVFKTRNTNPADTIEVDVIVGNETLAPFVTDVEGGRQIAGTSRKERVIKTPRIRPKKTLTAKDLYTERGEGVMPYVPNGASSVAAAREEKVAKEMKDLRNTIDRRIEWMCAQALTGTLTVTQDNIAFAVDYNMPAAHKIVLAGADQWDETTADVKANMTTAADLIQDALGIPADTVICGKDAAAALLNRVAEDKWFYENSPRLDPLGGFRWEASPSFLGRAGGLAFYRYGDTYDDAGTPTNFIAADKVYVIATNARLSIEFGNILDLKAGANVMAEYFSKSWEVEDPSVMYMLAESRPLPVLWQPEAVVEIDVV